MRRVDTPASYSQDDNYTEGYDAGITDHQSLGHDRVHGYEDYMYTHPAGGENQYIKWLQGYVQGYSSFH